MLLALGAASSALDALKALTSSKSSSQPGLRQSQNDPFDLSGGAEVSAGSTTRSGAGGCSQISPATMSALLDAQSQSSDGAANAAPASRSEALNNLFSKIDADGDGGVTKSEFEDALGAGGTNLARADSVFGKLDKDGDGSVSLDEMSSGLKGNGHHRHHATSESGSDPLTQALQGGAPASGAATSSYHFIEQMIARQARAIQASAAASLSVSA